MKKKVSKLTLNRETLRNLNDTEINQAVGGWSLGGTCDSCNYSCDPVSVRICPPTYDC
ncbi:MAG: hypothetical protein QOH06_2565 [Acidobacteriota bacterium]|jgi:hypothetical protein|nr:hypothetical protein [Acidobacteriota bacterium]